MLALAGSWAPAFAGERVDVCCGWKVATKFGLSPPVKVATLCAMPFSVAQSTSWDFDPAIFESLQGAEAVVKWFGFVPSFHDAAIQRMEFAKGNGSIEIATFRMTDEVDDKGVFVLDRHAVVTLHLSGVSGVLLDCHANPTVLEVGIRKVTSEHLPIGNTGASVGDFEIAFDDVCGGAGSIYARDIRVDLKPANFDG